MSVLGDILVLDDNEGIRHTVLSRREELLTQISGSIGLPVAMMGFFDKSRCVMTSSWQTRCEDCPTTAYRDIVQVAERCLSVQVALTSNPIGALAPDLGNPDDRNQIWLKADDYTVIAGKPVMGVYPVIAFPRMPQFETPVLRAALNIGLTYARQQLTEELYERSPWPEGLVESTLQALSLRFIMINDKAEIGLDGRLAEKPDSEDPDWVIVNGRLTLRDDKQRQQLHEAIAVATGPDKMTSIVAVSTRAGSMRLVVVAPLARAGGAPMALILFEHSQTDHQALREHFFRAHGLTRSECKIAHVVLDGGTLNEAAKSTTLSVETVRSYMKAIFVKTGTHRQSELTALYYKSILPVGTSIARAGRKHPD